MKTFKFIILLSLFIGIVGFVFAIFWDIPAPTQTVERVVQLDVDYVTPPKTSQPATMPETMNVR